MFLKHQAIELTSQHVSVTRYLTVSRRTIKLLSETRVEIFFDSLVGINISASGKTKIPNS